MTLGKFDAMPGMDTEPLDEFCCAKVDDKAALEPQSILRARLVPRLAGVLMGDERYDLAVLLSDLELKNKGRAPHVCDVVKHAVRLHVAGVDHRFAEATAEAFRERASFHLAVPMVESWLFGDPGLCVKNNVPQGREARLVAGRDREEFKTEDSAYEADDGASCVKLVERAKRNVERKSAP